MRMGRLLVSIPTPLRAKLNTLRLRGYTASGYIRYLLERELNKAPKSGRKG